MHRLSRTAYLALVLPQRKRAPSSRVEQSFHQALVELVDVALSPRWRFFHCPNGEARDKVTAAILMSMGVKRGVFDLIFLAPDAKTYFLELKRPGKALSKDQDSWREFYDAAGFSWGVASSLDQAVAILASWGALRRGVRVQ